jgi:hypothetical protein
MIKYTKTFKRPSLDVKFAANFAPTEGSVGEAREQMRALYYGAKKRLGFYSSLSQDKLTLTNLIFWESSEAYSEFKFQNAEVLTRANQILNEYNEQNGIEVTSIEETV